MARSDRDTWDAASSVGITATMIAVARAIASKGPNAIISDPFAEPLVEAVGIDLFSRLVKGDIAPTEISDDPKFSFSRLIDSMAVRTRFFDDFFTAATDAGVRQAVILASGLDSRAYRLPWPSGTVVFELDQPAMLEFKTRTLSRLGAKPQTCRRTVAIDLRGDWPAALRHNGFDEGQPTAWSAEGLLMYLPPDAQDRLLDDIGTLSATGSLFATEYHPDPTDLARRTSAMARMWAEHGLHLDNTELMYEGDRTPVTEYLTNHGWRVSGQSRSELLGAYGVTRPEEDSSAPLRNIIAITALRS